MGYRSRKQIHSIISHIVPAPRPLITMGYYFCAIDEFNTRDPLKRPGNNAPAQKMSGDLSSPCLCTWPCTQPLNGIGGCMGLRQVTKCVSHCWCGRKLDSFDPQSPCRHYVFYPISMLCLCSFVLT